MNKNKINELIKGLIEAMAEDACVGNTYADKEVCEFETENNIVIDDIKIIPTNSKNSQILSIVTKDDKNTKNSFNFKISFELNSIGKINE